MAPVMFVTFLIDDHDFDDGVHILQLRRKIKKEILHFGPRILF